MNSYIRQRKVKRRLSILGFNLDQTFFGYKPSDRLQLHESLFELIWQGQGRWDFDDVYYMPLPMRRLWIKKLNEKLNPSETTTTDNNSAK